MAPPLLTLQDIHLSFGGTPLLTGAELTLSEGERLCLVGRNGSGKSTLLKIAAGLIEPDKGERFLQPGTTIRYLAQEPDLSGYKTVLDYVEAGLSPNDDPYRARYLLEQLGLSGDEDPATLSGGELRRAALAEALAPEPDILFLDEPTNHLDLPAIQWLEDELSVNRSAMVLISHDRRFLEKLSRSTLWLTPTGCRRLNQGFAHFENWRDEVLELEEQERHKLDRKIHREEHWLRYGVTARRKRNVRRLGELHALRQKRREQILPTGKVQMETQEAEASGKLVIEAKGISKSYDGRPIVTDLDLRIQRGDRIGIIGANGTGKTTLVNLLTGALAPDEGTVRMGATVEMVSLDQRREALNPDWSLRDALTGGGGDMVHVGDQQRHVMSYMKDFLFLPEQAGTAISRLSGGERGRLMLARALARPSNLLVLDEPTNDLDLETLDLLQELLADYSGTVLLVSHDRDFLDRIVTSVLVSEGNGLWQSYAGGYSDMLAQRGREMDVREEAKSERPSAKVARPAAEKTRPAAKLSFKDKHALEKLPGEMEALQNRIAEMEAALADGDFFARDPEGFNRTAEELERARQELAAKEEQWLELEMKREELEGG